MSYTLNTIFIFPFFMFLYVIAFQQSKCTLWITNTKKPKHTELQNSIPKTVGSVKLRSLSLLCWITERGSIIYHRY